MEALLSYMYAGVASVAQHDLASLLKAAEALCIKGLAAPDGCETQSSSSSSSGGNNTSSPKSKRRKREDSIPSATGGTNDTCNSNRNLEELSQPAVQNDHQTRLSPYNEHIESRVREEETKEIINTSRDDTRELLVDHRTPQMPEKSELECTPDMPFKDIFDDMQVKEEELDNSVDEQDLSYNSEINYHTLPDGSRQISESDVGLEDQMTQGYFSKYEAPDTNQRNLPLDSSGHVNPPHPDPGDNHKPGPSRMMENTSGSDAYDGFLGLDAYNCDNQQDLYSQLTDPMNMHNHQPHLSMIQNNSNALYRGPGRPPKALAHLYSEKKMHRCGQCNYSTPWHSVFIRHCRRHSGEKPFSCEFCPFRSSRKSVVNRHCMSKHSSVNT
ncbi:RE1-silencing transcription factor B-like isoform X2 [Homarus americanus]|nr:RE1-silencing transcription factor B-like isoform X2 [Homarus americanus]